MGLKQRLQEFVRKTGYEIVRYSPKNNVLFRRKKLIDSYKIEVVIDVGANTGQYGRELRSIGFMGKIISFEPTRSAYSELERLAKADGAWETFNFALGNTEGRGAINIAGNSESSSILNMLPSQLMCAPESAYVGTEQVEIKTLDSLFGTLCNTYQSILLKSDTQGFDKMVIQGAGNSLRFIDTIQIEMPFIALYENASLFDEIFELLNKKGYRIVGIEPGFINERTGELLEVDGIFHRF